MQRHWVPNTTEKGPSPRKTTRQQNRQGQITRVRLTARWRSVCLTAASLKEVPFALTTRTETVRFLREYTELNHKEFSLEIREAAIREDICNIKRRAAAAKRLSHHSSLAQSAAVTSIVLGLMALPAAALAAGLVFGPLPRTFGWSWGVFGAHPYLCHILLCFFITTLLSFPLALEMCKSQRAADAAEQAQCEQEVRSLPSLRRNLAEVSQQRQSVQSRLRYLQSTGPLHPDCFADAEQLLWYFDTGRADTLKEALNLLDHDREEDDRRADAREFRREMQGAANQQQKTLNHISDEAERVSAAVQAVLACDEFDTALDGAQLELLIRQNRKQAGLQ